MSTELSSLVEVDKDECISCHQCISVCGEATKLCNDGSSGDYVEVNSDRCIGCGECISACQHEARVRVDDWELFRAAIDSDQQLVAIVAPSVAANFPTRYLNLNGWLEAQGVEAIFDVSFGAELTVKSYLDYLEKDDPDCLIAQPCPVIVSYIQIYHPELLDYLAPADSPMLHTIKMIEEFYPQYSDHQVVAISPCIAKKREFESVNRGDKVYNITFQSLVEHFETSKQQLADYPQSGFSGPETERAAGFSTPGGLLRTVQREIPGADEFTRKIEGPSEIHQYFADLKESIAAGYAPLLIDCLNCSLGCNGGTGVETKGKSRDELDANLRARVEDQKQEYQESELPTIEAVIDNHWQPGLYNREYQDLSVNRLDCPAEAELEAEFEKLRKYEPADRQIDCASCGYDSCQLMAKALYYGLNQPENCHFYEQKLIEEYTDHLEELVEERTEELTKTNQKLETKNEKIMDSIEYAETIQESVLPAAETLESNLTDHFVIWQPTGMVGGDFYWQQEVAAGLFLAVVDCTGHGVPGALMTMTANSILNGIVTDSSDHNPARILAELNRVLKDTLKQKRAQSSSRREMFKQDDGLDIGLCYLPAKEDKLVYAGAGIDLFYTDEQRIARIAADRQGIGYSRSQLDYEYTTHQLDLKADRVFYLTSDGYLDQGGGPENKRFGRDRFVQMLTENCDRKLEEQKKIFVARLENYMEDEEQRDDITLLGFKV